MEIKILNTQYHQFAFTYPYDMGVIEFCRLLKGSWGWQEFSFDNTYKAWVFSRVQIIEAIIARYPDVLVSKEVKDLCGITELEQLAEEVKLHEMTLVKKSEDSEIDIPGFKGELRPFQRVGVEFLVKSGVRAILGDDPGLGKTVQSIGAILHTRAERALVVCPATMKYTWESEVAKFSDLSTVVINSATDISKIDEATKVWIVNYDLLKRYVTELHKVKFDFMVLDEAHYIKTPNTIRSRAVKILAADIPHIVMLSGTIVLNRPSELFNPLTVIDPKKWNNYWRYVERYCGAHRTRFGLDVSGATNTAELKQKLDAVFLRRRKEDVLPELPEKIRIEVPVDLEGKASRAYHKAYSDFATFLKENKGKKDIEIAKTLQADKLVKINLLREVAAEGKVDDAIEIIENVTSNGAKIIVFASFVAPLKKLEEHFGEACVLITGQTPNEERFEIVKRFQSDPSIKVFLGGIKSAGVGITLTEASNVLFLDYSWTPADHKQAEDRAHRIGSTHQSITIYQMHARGTMDDIMRKMLAKKRDVVEKIIGVGDDQSAMSMVLEEITKQALNK